MKYITEFRDTRLAALLSERIDKMVDKSRQYNIMEFCGGHTHAIYRYGIPSLLPSNINLIHGPGCPVCVLPIARIDYAIALACLPNVIFCSYGDMLRVPGSNQSSLLKAKARGAQVKMVYSINDALNIARLNPNKQVIFFAIGFETTTPPTAVALLLAKKENIKNFSVFCNHVLTPPAMKALLLTDESSKDDKVNIDGFIGPAHVSIVIGSKAYQTLAMDFKKAIVISGFEPLDIMYSTLMLIEILNKGNYGIKNQYTRAVLAQGNLKSQALMAETLVVRDEFEWRGLGFIPHSGMKINSHYQEWDAEKRFPLKFSAGREHKLCQCAAILRGAKKPIHCELFAKACTPANPLGSCMVSSEGACHAYYTYRRNEDKNNDR